MKEKLLSRLEKSKEIIRYWWTIAIVGIVMILVGIVILFIPNITYMILSTVLGFIIFISGISHLALATNSQHIITGKAWLLIGSIIEAIFGIILIFNTIISALVLPIILGLWILFRGLNLIGVGDDMNIMEIPGSGWTLFLGILVILCAFIILSQPFIFGTEMVITWVSASFVILGSSLIVYAFQLKNMHKHLQ